MKWQPIETAPRDNRDVLIFNGDYVSIGWFNKGFKQWCYQDTYQQIIRPTHWMPLPKPPMN